MKQAPVVIFDLDNCLAEDEHRQCKIDWSEEDSFKRYHEYHMLSAFDEPRNESTLWWHHDEGHEIFIVTSRPEHYRDITERWLALHAIPYDRLLMRPNHHQGASPELKLELIQAAGIQFERIYRAYDDRLDVLEAYEKVGIETEFLYINWRKEKAE
jgi:hypothetical protein